MDTSEVKYKKDTTRNKMPIAIYHGKEILYKVYFLTDLRPADLFRNFKEIRASSQCCPTKIESKNADFHV